MFFGKKNIKPPTKEMFMENCRDIVVYSDGKETLYMIPSGYNPQFSVTMEIDVLNILNSPYTDRALEDMIQLTFSQCYSKDREDINSVGPLEKHFKLKRYSTAVRGIKCVSILWNKEDGYSVIPTSKEKPKGFFHLRDKIKKLGLYPVEGAMAVALRQAIKESTTY